MGRFQRAALGAAILTPYGYLVGLPIGPVLFALLYPGGAYWRPQWELAGFGALLGAYVGLRPRSWRVLLVIGIVAPVLWQTSMALATMALHPGDWVIYAKLPRWTVQHLWRERVWEMLLMLPAAHLASRWIDRRARELGEEEHAEASSRRLRRDEDGVWNL